MIFLFDTNAVSDYMDGHARIAARLAAVAAGDQVVICATVLGEIRFGIERLPPGRRRSNIEARATAALAGLVCEPVPCAAAGEHARLKQLCRTRGVALDENDLWIAATALALGAVLVSRDLDFTRVSGLTVEDWAT